VLPCCHAFVMHIGACLLSAAQNEPDVRELLEQADGWNAFISPCGALTAWEATQSKPLGGLAPSRGSDNESDDDDEIDASTMERVLAAQAAANQSGGDSVDANGDDDDDDDGHSSEYLQHFAQYLSNRNFLNQTSDNVHDFASMSDQLPPPPSNESWTAEFDEFDPEGSSVAAPPSAPTEGGGGATTPAAEGAGSSDFADFESLSSSSAPADGHASDAWAAFDAGTGPAASSESAPSAEPAADADASAAEGDADAAAPPARRTSAFAMASESSDDNDN